MKCPKCKSDFIVQAKGLYVKKIYWCDECDNEWVK
jgi:transposase-like protein